MPEFEGLPRNTTLPVRFVGLILIIFGLAVLIIGTATFERYEVRKIQRCVKIIGTKYYRAEIFSVKSSPQGYSVLADGREIRDYDLERDAFGNHCDYVYEKAKPNVSFQELKTPR